MKMSKKLVLVGAGGHAASVLDCIGLQQFDEIALIDIPQNKGKEVLNFSVQYSDDDLASLFANGFTYAFVAVGSILNTDLRHDLSQRLTSIGFTMINVIDPSAIVSPYAILSEGIFIGKRVVVNARATIEEGSILNTGAIIEHDCVVGPFCHVSVNATLCGEVTLGSDVHVGAGSVIKQTCHVGSRTVIGIGSVVTRDLPSNVVAFGNPCKEVRSL